MARDIYPSFNEEVDFSSFRDEPRPVNPNPNDDPCPRCKRNEGAWDGASCVPCGYVRNPRTP